jgi:uncharacterized membrane protein YhaH (DUF805 family)
MFFEQLLYNDLFVDKPTVQSCPINTWGFVVLGGDLGDSEIIIVILFTFLIVTSFIVKRLDSDISYQWFILFMFFLHAIANEFATIGQGCFTWTLSPNRCSVRLNNL